MTATQPSDSTRRWLILALDRPRPADGRARRDDREHRAAVAPRRPWASPTTPASGSSPPTRWRSAACCCSAAASATSSAASASSSSASPASPSPPRSAALAQSFGVLVAARALQGVFAALLAPARPLPADHHLHRSRRSATRRSASSARSPAPAPPSACCSAAC